MSDQNASILDAINRLTSAIDRQTVGQRDNTNTLVEAIGDVGGEFATVVDYLAWVIKRQEPGDLVPK